MPRKSDHIVDINMSELKSEEVKISPFADTHPASIQTIEENEADCWTTLAAVTHGAANIIMQTFSIAELQQFCGREPDSVTWATSLGAAAFMTTFVTSIHYVSNKTNQTVNRPTIPVEEQKGFWQLPKTTILGALMHGFGDMVAYGGVGVMAAKALTDSKPYLLAGQIVGDIFGFFITVPETRSFVNAAHTALWIKSKKEPQPQESRPWFSFWSKKPQSSLAQPFLTPRPV